MYNLVLVDDEEIVLTGIQKVFKMADYQFNIIGAFSNPLKALESLVELSPDLIITDIKMPQMNGLEFSTRAKQLLPKAEIVILSGYDDFTFAQSAVKLGVSDYLLKPIKKKDFEKMLLSMHDKIENRNNQELELEQLQKAVMINHSALRNKFFLTLVEHGNFLDPYIQALYTQLGFNFKDSPFILVKFVIYEMQPEEDYVSATEKIISEFTGCINGLGSSEAFYSDEYLYFYLYGIQKTTFNRQEFLQIVLSYSRNKAENRLHLLVGVSQIYNSITDLFFATSDCDEYILKADSESADAGNILGGIQNAQRDLRLPYTEMENIFTAISTNDTRKITESVEEIFNLPDTALYKNYFYSIALILLIRMAHLQNKYKAETIIISLNILDIKQLSKNYPSVKQIKELIIQKSNLLAELVHSQSIAPASETMLSALHYIDKHYNENISLSDVADKIFISKNYLCDLFKKELNTTFIDYVTSMRIEKAKYLLTQTNMKMYEISKEVGYNDYAYFSQIFKRYTGITLSNYRKHN
ncbi:response regulator transcription factor [Parasporobacterium paucivorans]|uniref:Stage 0 sporulation protein A homolog n=1 Tax=Parasporobacterium paucivorans DSM 15970 TaxID=1122934 RepID=A0A1M6LH06_9FIRM|nr:response regulator [Parasporobacterium paucivorans]SHJ70484.1 two-component system, response regulator YesN [Parasporobacterium paucivorans DSM 15970]